MNASKITNPLDGGPHKPNEAESLHPKWTRTASLVLSRTRHIFSRASFIITHYAYFTALVLLSSLVFWASSHPSRAVGYTDSLFLVVSAISGTGLNTVDLSALTAWQQTILFLLIMLGGTVWVSLWVHALRRRRFARGVGRHPVPNPHHHEHYHRQRGEVHVERACALNLDKPSIFSRFGPGSSGLCATTGTMNAQAGGTGEEGQGGGGEGSAAASIEDRAFAAMGLLARLYFVLWQALGCLALGAYIARAQPDAARANGVNPWWAGVFNGVSAFNNSGLSLLDANMTAFQRTPFVVVTMGLMILAGNTMYPIFMRVIVWAAGKLLGVMSSCTSAHVRTSGSASTYGAGLEGWAEVMGYILRHPRRFHTHLFRGRDTWWLVGTVVVINAVGWTGFEVLSVNNPAIEAIPVRYRVLDGLFQSISTRSGGFSVVAMSDVYPSVRLLYIFMMYIPTVPLALSARRSLPSPQKLDALEDAQPDEDSTRNNGTIPGASRPASTAHNEPSTALRTHRSIPDAEPASPVSDSDQTFAVPEPSTSSRRALEPLASFAWRQMQHQLAHDIWLLALAVFLISTIENAKWVADPVAYSVFNVVFEVVSAYGCVGVSAGVPGASYSFAGGWRAGSKVILCLVMMVGRHRGLPLLMEEYDDDSE